MGCFRRPTSAWGAIHPFRPICVVLILAMGVASAHESPEHTIHALDEQTNLTPAELHQRALAHRAIHELDEAIRDLQAAIAKEPKHLGYRLELCGVQLAAGESIEARHTAEHALMLADSADQRARIQILRAESYQLEDHSKEALAAIRLAFQEIPKGEIDWILLRSECQRALGLHEERIDDLTEGLADHPSAVIRTHRLDALIDAAEFSIALKEIDEELADRRWKSSYLIKRARCLSGLGKQEEAEIALRSALGEIASRLNPQRPDLFLLADQGLAYALLDEDKEAGLSLELLKQNGAPDWMITRLQEAIASK